jgi:hypothetical protein
MGAGKNYKKWCLGLVLLGIGLLLFRQEAFGYQVKRVIRGDITTPSTIEAGTVDISSYLGEKRLNA